MPRAWLIASVNAIENVLDSEFGAEDHATTNHHRTPHRGETGTSDAGGE
jgi:hypothetical protein